MKRDLVDITKRLRDLADFVDSKHSEYSISTSSSLKKLPEKSEVGSPAKARRVTWDQSSMPSNYFKGNPSKAVKTRKSTYNFGLKDEIKEVVDEGADENGLKINLNLCPSYEDEISKDKSAYMQTNSSYGVNSCSSSSSYDFVIQKSISPPIAKKRKRKIRKMTTNFLTVGGMESQHAKTLSNNKTGTMKKFEWKMTSTSNIDQLSNLSPGGLENSSASSSPDSQRKKSKAGSNRKMTMPTKNILNLIGRLKDLEKEM